MKYLLSLCLTDLTEMNRVPPGDLNITPLTVGCMAYEAIQRCASPKHSFKNGIYMFYKSFMSPTFRGKSSIKERIIDAMYSFVSQLIVSSYKLHGEKVVFSNSEVRGTLERLFDIEKDEDKRDMLKEYVEKFKFTN